MNLALRSSSDSENHDITPNRYIWFSSKELQGLPPPPGQGSIESFFGTRSLVQTGECGDRWGYLSFRDHSTSLSHFFPHLSQSLSPSDHDHVRWQSPPAAARSPKSHPDRGRRCMRVDAEPRCFPSAVLCLFARRLGDLVIPHCR